jgi:hypothetical protein
VARLSLGQAGRRHHLGQVQGLGRPVRDARRQVSSRPPASPSRSGAQTAIPCLSRGPRERPDPLPAVLHQRRHAGRQYAALAALPENLQGLPALIVVDDGSPRDPPARLRRPTSACRWRSTASSRRRLEPGRRPQPGRRQARTDWLILTDIDHVLAESTFDRVIVGKLREDTVYKFGVRLDAPGLAPKLKNGKHHPHPNSWVMTRAMYDRIGGYDEALAGNYGTDGDFARRAEAAAPIELPGLAADPLSARGHRRRLDHHAAAQEPGRQGPHARDHARPRPGWRPLRGLSDVASNSPGCGSA